MHTRTKTKHKTYITWEKKKDLSWELKDIDELYKSNILNKIQTNSIFERDVSM